MNTRYNAMLNLRRQEDYGVPTNIPSEGRADSPSVARSITLSKFSLSECDQSKVESRVTFTCSVHILCWSAH